MAIEQILADWKNDIFKPIYWLEGEEAYDIDHLTNFAEKRILTEEQASFNLSVFYGKDAKIEEVLNACKRYPMFSDKQVVILKEAQQIKEIEKLEHYIENPLSSTIFVVAYKEKTLDKRKSFAKLVQKKTVMVTTKKLYDNELPEWTASLIKRKGLDIKPKALQILVDHIGNDLQRIENEIDKICINLKGKTSITEDDIENFVGVSKEFNIFELQSALISKDLPKCLTIINYFASNPKAVPIQIIMPTLYAYFSKLYVASSSSSRDENSIAALLGIKGFFAKQYMQGMQKYTPAEVEKVLLLLHHYNLKSLGIGRSDASDAALMKEFIAKAIY